MFSLSEVMRLVIGFLYDNSQLNIETDTVKIFSLSDNLDMEKRLVKVAADRLVQEKVLHKLDEEGNYILEKPLAQVTQNIQIDYNTAINISRVINTICHDIGDEKNLADPLNIQEIDLLNLLNIIDNYEKYGNGSGKQ